MIIAINYANEKYVKSQKYNTKTAYKNGKVDKVIEYSPEDIDDEFRKCNQNIFKCERGDGYWIWKPYIILKTLEKAKNGDYVFYADSGSYYIDKVQKMIEVMDEEKVNIMSFELPFIEKRYTKREVFEAFNMWGNIKNMNSPQRLATFILVKCNLESVNFFKEFLDYACKKNLINDYINPNKVEDKDFVENRHDQSIFSLLCKKWNLPVYRDPSEYGIKPKLYHFKDKYTTEIKCKCDYPQILVSHRKKNPSLIIRFDGYLRSNIRVDTYENIAKIRDFGIKIYKLIK